MLLRTYHPDDLPILYQLFCDTIYHINKQDYTSAQIAQWAPPVSEPILQGWAERLGKSFTQIAVLKEMIVGFGNIDPSGYLDFLYVHKDFQQQGVASTIYKALENKAIKQKNTSILSEVSITARPFFEYKGFYVIKKQENLRGNEILINFKMEKLLQRP